MTQPATLAELVATAEYASARRKLAALHSGQGGQMLTHEEGEVVEQVRDLAGRDDPADWPDPA